MYISGNIYMLEGINGFAGGNIGVSIGNDGILIVDDQFSEMNEKIRTALAKLKPGQPRFVLNTHWHGDIQVVMLTSVQTPQSLLITMYANV